MRRRIPKGLGITLKGGPFGYTYLIVHDSGRDLLIQSDWDYPNTAYTFGWGPRRQFRNDTEEIQAAQKFLDRNIGKRVEDPGYF